MAPSSKSRLPAIYRAALWPQSVFGSLFLFLSWATYIYATYYPSDNTFFSWATYPYTAYIPSGNIPTPDVTNGVDLDDLFLVAVSTALLLVKWNVIDFLYLYHLAVSDAALLYILKKMSGRKSDTPPRWVTRWVTPFAALFRAIFICLYPGLTEMMEEVRRDVKGPVGEHQGRRSIRR